MASLSEPTIVPLSETERVSQLVSLTSFSVQLLIRSGCILLHRKGPMTMSLKSFLFLLLCSLQSCRVRAGICICIPQRGKRT